MSLRPPTSIASMPAREPALGAFESEIIAEQASSLARAGRRLEAALAALAGFDRGVAPRRPDLADVRSTLVAGARQALWYRSSSGRRAGFEARVTSSRPIKFRLR